VAFEPISEYGNYFVGIDGEGVGNDYALLDSSLDDYPRLYTGSRLTTRECLDWLWGLGTHAGYCTFVLFGAGYDYNNWLRDLPFEDVQKLANGQLVRFENYLILWQQRFKFEIRKVARDNPASSPEPYVYERIRTSRGEGQRTDYIGLTFWDVLPFWQSSFVKALDMTLKERSIERTLIEEGKEARGTFTHENIEWVSQYNKAECHNLAWMMVELDKWFRQSSIKPMFYNGPGSAAKALLRTHATYLHAGRRIASKTRKVSSMVQEYIFPGADSPRAMQIRALSAYAGALNRQLMIGYHPGRAYQYDIISAYPAGELRLPCLSHGHWARVSRFDPHAFGLWKVRYRASKKMLLYPYFWRSPDGSIEYPFAFDERWMHTDELACGLYLDPAGTRVVDGWKWIPSECDNPRPFWWIADAFKQRQQWKKEGNDGASNGLKLPLNSTYGSIAQARGGTPQRPPWSQQILWAGAITAYTRTRLRLAFELNPSAIVHLATDGIISLEPLPLALGSGLGEWEETTLTDLTVVQYGIYAAREKHRERGFRLSDSEIPDFVARVHDMWRTGHWNSLSVTQKLFVTCGLVAMSEARYDEWCTWKDVTKLIELDQASVFKMGHVAGVPGMWRVADALRSTMPEGVGSSAPYVPKWGRGEDFPREWRVADEMEAAMAVGV
jgi:hypothetical protein